MLSLVLRECKLKGFSSINLEVRNNNTAAVAAYRKQGFEFLDIRPDNSLVVLKIS